MTRYIFIGAGAIGGTIGGRLHQYQHVHGSQVVLVARGKHGKALAGSGLTLRSPQDTTRVSPTVVSGPEELQLAIGDVLVLTTKTQQAEAALRQWVDRPVYSNDGNGKVVGTAGERLPIFTALNGVASERMALRYFRRVFAVCVWLPAVHLSAGEVLVRIAPGSGTFFIGRYPAQATDGGRPGASPAADVDDRKVLDRLAHDWTASSFTVHLRPDVMNFKYSKLMSNLANGLQALLGTDGASYTHLVEQVQDEARLVYQASGVRTAPSEEEAALRNGAFDVQPVPGEPTGMGGSSWQSLARNTGSVETDFLNGEIVYLARLYGVPAPMNEVVQGMTRRAAAAGSTPGDINVSEVELRFSTAMKEAGQ
ncbi:2-dehydropantoate 2-reductase N-terminal domain-containing protein [Saxibacter everestensis]|uniref:2-dehydropantoate 2-reductase N-terminal domain-containing protein n=1 Tax=Saxibacter everestensis TaxID=2909229 RepID=A0ABY8QUC4_9MICO|nr:2-dehydropantoate 2-reductase N-terminal domain-containing protein [Brevibacteriaceae bacterium ZFBP1038]